ncbi:MAG: hypothetical protein E6R03_16665 [Hyphomicrobiaceae bacterium]|nr:MAG: hypothetical protein E6R03_16665 [Hyphomicrobiaceae bacterium]
MTTYVIIGVAGLAIVAIVGLLAYQLRRSSINEGKAATTADVAQREAEFAHETGKIVAQRPDVEQLISDLETGTFGGRTAQ